MRHSPGDIIHSRIRHPTPLKNVQPLLCCLCLSDRLYQCLQLLTVCYSLCIRHESVVHDPLGSADASAEYAEEPIVTATQHDTPIGSFEAFVWHNAGMRSSPAP